MPGDDHSARTRLLARVDLVRLREPLTLVRFPQLLREIVVPDGSRVHHRVGRQNILGAQRCQHHQQRTGSWQTHSSSARSVLGRASRNVRHFVVFDDLVVAGSERSSEGHRGRDDGKESDVHRLMLLLGQDRIVGHEIILFQQLLSVSDLQIEKRVT